MKTKIFFFSLICILCIGCLFLVNNDLSNTNASLNGQLQQQEITYSGRIDALTASQQDLSDKIDVLQSKNATLIENNNALQKSYDELRIAYNQYVKDSTLEREQIQSTVVNLKDTIATLEDNADIDQSTISDLHSQVKTLETSLENQTTTANQLQATIMQQEVTIAQLNETIADLEITIDEMLELLNRDLVEQVAFYTKLVEGTVTEVKASDLEGVTTLRPNLFSKLENLETVELPDSLKTIGERCFSACYNLTSITFGSNLETIGERAFISTGLVSLEFPDSVTTIGYSAFSSCFALKSIKLPNNLEVLDGQVLYGCDRLEYVVFPDNLVEIKSNAIWSMSLTGLNFSNCKKLQIISSQAICPNISAVTNLPDSLISINYDSIANYTAWSSLVDRFYVKDGICFGDDSTFYSRRTIPDCVKKIAGYANINCTSLYVPSSVEMFMPCAFAKNTRINYIYFSGESNLKEIGNSAFSSSKISSFDIPESVVKIGGGAFAYTNISSCVIPETVEQVGSSLFRSCKSLVSVTLPSTLDTLGNMFFYYCSKLSTLDIPESVTSIGSDCFLACSSLTSIVIPNSVNRIGSSCFRDCTKLTSVTLSTSLTELPDFAFYGCSLLSSITIPDSVTTIDTSCFSGCANLSSVDFPENLISLGDNVFLNCSALTSLVLPSNVQSISSTAFKNVSLTTLTVEAIEPPTLGTSLPGTLSVIYIPNGTLESYLNAEYWSYCSVLFVEMDPVTISPAEDLTA